MNDLIIVGAGGLGREVFWVVQEINRIEATWNVIGFLDDNTHALDDFPGYGDVFGPPESYRNLDRPYAVCAIGMPEPRRKVVGCLAAMNARWATLVDPSASIGVASTVGEGCVFRKHALVTVNVRVGNHVLFGCGAQASHDSRIGDFCTLCGHVNVNGGVILDEGVFLGSHACVMPRVRAGAWARIGAGTVAVRDVPRGTTIFGVPGRNIPRPIDRPEDPKQNCVYLSPPHMSPQDRALLLEAFDSNWIASSGPQVDSFEKEFAELVGVKDTVAVSCGTAALHLALVLLGVGPGDEVLTSTLTFIASANAIVYLGATPVFIDSDRATWNMDPQLLGEELQASARRKKLPKAVLVVDLYGQCADYGPICEACARYDVPIIEDAAESLGAVYNGQPAGTFGVLGAFSFNGNKIITAGNGGMLVCPRREMAQQARFLATQARDPAPHYQHSRIGYNYRMSNLLAAVGRGQLHVLEERVRQRRANYEFYSEALGDVPGIAFMPEHPLGRSTRWLSCITVNPKIFSANRDDIQLALQAERIESRPTWKPMHLQPVFSGCRVRGGTVAEQIFEQGLCLPSGSNLSAVDRLRVANIVRAVGGCCPVVHDAQQPQRKAA